MPAKSIHLEEKKRINYVDQASQEVKKPVKVNPNFELIPQRYKPLQSDVKKFRCCMCGNEYTKQVGNFVSGGKSPLWKGNGGYVPFCKACCEYMMETLTSFYGGNEEHALKHICQMFDWYYSPAASAMTLTQAHSGGARISLYPSKMSTRQVLIKGESYLDTVRDDFNDAQREVTPVDIEEETEENSFVVTKDMIRRWSTGLSADEYEFLESEYEDWNNKVEVTSKSQEELIKAMCLSQLNVRRAQASGNSKAVAEAMKSLQDLMTSCNLTPRQASEIANAKSAQQSLGQLIKKIEDEKPIGEPTAEFKDPDGIRKYLTAFFFGHLAKALHIKNDYQEYYDKEMAKYTVELTNERALDENAVSIFDDQDTEENKEEVPNE